MIPFEDHIYNIREKNDWYADNYDLKHVVTFSDLRVDFEAVGINVVEERFNAEGESNIHEFCWSVGNHYHYVLEVPLKIIIKAYNDKKHWASIVNFENEIVKNKTNNNIKSQDHYENLLNYLSKYPTVGYYVKNEEEEVTPLVNYSSTESETSDTEDEDDVIKKLEEKLVLIKKRRQEKRENLEKIRKYKEQKKQEELEKSMAALTRMKEQRELQVQDRQQKLDTIRGVEFMDEHEKKELKKEISLKEKVLKLFPKWIKTTEQDLDEAKAGCIYQSQLKNVINAYAYIQTSKMNELHTQTLRILGLKVFK